MNAFLDTSVLLKLYHDELGTQDLLTQLATVEQLFLSRLTEIELCSALWKKVRTKEISLTSAELLVAAFLSDASKFNWIELHDERVRQAARLVIKYGKVGLRSLDALQLASALTLREMPNTVFLTSDTVLKHCFTQEALDLL